MHAERPRAGDESSDAISAMDVLPARIDPPARPLSWPRLLAGIARNPIETWPSAVYKEPLYQSSVLGHRYLFVTSPDLIRQVLVDDADSFHKGVVMRRALQPALGDAILTSDGAKWRWQRRAAAPMFRHESLVRLLPSVIACAQRTRERWLSYPAGAEIDVAREMMRTTFDIILATMLPGRGNIDPPSIERSITEYLESTSWVMLLTIIGAPHWVPHPGFRKARRGKTYLKQVLGDLIVEARRRPSGQHDLLSLLIEAKDPETGRSMNDGDIRDNLLTFITAGHETTSLALTWTFYLLSLHPAAEQCVRREIAAVTDGGQLRPDHIEQLTYTRQVISEAMRLYPPAPVIAREAQRDIRLGDQEVKSGTVVYVPVYAVHRHELLWDNPDLFAPERFDAEAAKARNRYIYLPFGAGPRICIGMGFAFAEATAILATLVGAFTLRLRPGYVPKPKLRVTLRPDRGMPMRLFPAD